MGSGNRGLYSGAYTGEVIPGSADFMKENDDFSIYIKKRKDIDVNGFYDVIAHGGDKYIIVENNGKSVQVNHRIFAKLLKKSSDYSNGDIRLLSCSTGKVATGFAQNLANKLNRVVMAPSDYLWVRKNGTYFVAGAKFENGELVPNYSKPGRFIKYYPKRRKSK